MKKGHTEVKYYSGSSGIGLTLFKPFISINDNENETWVGDNIFSIDALRDLVAYKRYEKYVNKGFDFDTFSMCLFGEQQVNKLVKIFPNEESALDYFKKHSPFNVKI